MAGKRGADGSQRKQPAPGQRCSRQEDFSSVIKSRLSTYTRTGQACDRCKVRKIRCDAEADGCTHCVNLGVSCYVTDRTSGRTERRGYTRELERNKAALEAHIAYLETKLAENNIPFDEYKGPSSSPTSPKDADRSKSEDHTVVDVACRPKDGTPPQASSQPSMGQMPTALMANPYQHFVPTDGSPPRTPCRSSSRQQPRPCNRPRPPRPSTLSTEKASTSTQSLTQHSLTSPTPNPCTTPPQLLPQSQNRSLTNRQDIWDHLGCGRIGIKHLIIIRTGPASTL
ncbi:hypothetical protein B0I35DRAFT_277451 [Stachybotrys elegans]|uniref:Zn(2)-C6 fungal-type domain-containing protein n=1 Tax=Stachybotrys elegans TaxID=80388 RepID=A0A8K0SNX8_9HYPO|nr:hypothetical protein B0I35DRAFT_277451 [Stachybotrys elegans]